MASKTINELTLKLNADVAELKKDLAKGKTALTGFQKSISSIGDSIKGAFAVGAIVAAGKQLFDFGKQLVNTGGELAGVKTAFNKLNQPGLLDELRSATKGTINDLTLMKSAVKSSEFNIPIERMGVMMQFASMQAQKMGESVEYMAESITTGLSRGSAQILDNLGISVKELNAEAAKTGSIAEAAFNIMDRKIKESGGIIETAATITARWGATWENIKGGIGLLINHALVKIAPILDDIGAWFVKVWKVSSQFIIDTYNGWVDLYNNSLAFRLLIESISFAFTAVWQTVKLFFNLMLDNLKLTGKLVAYVFNPSNWGKGFGDGLTKILGQTAGEIVGDVKNYGTEIGKAFDESLSNAMKADAKKITSLIPDWLGAGSGGGINEIKTTAENTGKEIAKSINEGIQSIDIEPLKELKTLDLGKTINVNSMQEKIGAFKGQMTKITQSVVEMTELVQDAIGSGFEMIGESIGNMMSGGGGIQNIFKGFLGVLSNFMSAFGKVLISIGVAKMALDKIFINPAGAIIAGVALIALSKIASNMMAKQKFAGGGVVGGYSFSGDRVPILANSGEMILNPAQQSSLFKMINTGTGGGGSLVARVSGNDLLFVLEQTKTKKSYTY